VVPRAVSATHGRRWLRSRADRVVAAFPLWQALAPKAVAPDSWFWGDRLQMPTASSKGALLGQRARMIVTAWSSVQATAGHN
jgi:hypothetical protein